MPDMSYRIDCFCDINLAGVQPGPGRDEVILEFEIVTLGKHDGVVADLARVANAMHGCRAQALSGGRLRITTQFAHYTTREEMVNQVPVFLAGFGTTAALSRKHDAAARQPRPITAPADPLEDYKYVTEPTLAPARALRNTYPAKAHAGR